MATVLKTPSDEGVIRSAVNTLPHDPQVGWYVLISAILGSSMAFLDSSVVGVALPLLQADLHATTADVQWVMELYLLFLAAFILVGGILGDHYGRRRIFVIGMVIFILYAAFGGIVFLLPFDLIQVQGYPPVAAAAVLIPYFLLMFLLSRWAERLADRFGARLLLVAGPLITAIGMALFAVPGIGGVYWVTFFPAVLVMGLGMALNTAPMTTVVMASVEQRHAGIASAINNAVARIGSLLAIAILGVVIISGFKNSLDAHLAHLSLSPGVRHIVDAQHAKLAGIQLPAGINSQVHAVLKLAIDESYVSGFRLAALVCAGLALAGALCGWLMIEDMPSKRTSDAVTGERAVDENELSVSTAPGGLPGSHA